MLVILWFMVLCFTAGAQEPMEALAEDIWEIIEYLQEGMPLPELYTRNPGEVTSNGYPGESSTEEHWPSPPPQHPEEHWPSPPPQHPEEHWPSPPPQHPEEHWPSPPPQHPEEHWPSPPPQHPEEHWPSPPPQHPEEHWPSPPPQHPEEHWPSPPPQHPEEHWPSPPPQHPEEHWPSPPPQHPEEHWPSPPPQHPEEHWPSPPPQHPEEHWPSPPPQHPEEHWPSPPPQHPEEHWPSPPPQHPEEHWPSPRPEYTPVDHSDVQPDECDDHGHSEHPYEEHKPGYPMQVGSLRGIPGINFPDYKDIPITHFSCSDKVHTPGFYADMETGCQVFHVCWPRRRESFLCPVGTIFNQAILACDYWYSSTCSLASHYYDVNPVSFSSHTDKDYKGGSSLGSMVDTLLEGYGEPKFVSAKASPSIVSKESIDLSQILKFLPVKAKVVVHPKTPGSRSKIIAEASVGKTEKPHWVEHASQKPLIHEEIQSEDIAVRQKSTAVPRIHQKVVMHEVKSPHREKDQYVGPILDIGKKPVKVPVSVIPVEDGYQKSKHQHKVRKDIPLTKLNPRFITKPVKVPKHHVIKPEIKHSIKFPKPHPHTRPQTKVVSFPTRKHAVSGFRSHANIFPSTKKVLAKSLLKMLKMRSGDM